MTLFENYPPPRTFTQKYNRDVVREEKGWLEGAKLEAEQSSG